MTRLRVLLLGCFVLSVTLQGMAQQWGLYTIIPVQNQTTVKLIDTSNVVYKTWTLTGNNGYSAYMLPGRVMMRSVTVSNSTFQGGGMTGKVQKVDWNGTVIWDYTYSTSTYCMHHDFCPMPNGNVLLISYESKTAAEVTAAGCSTSHIMWPDKIVEVQPTGATTGTVVWEWHAWDHLVQNYDASKANYGVVNEHPELFNLNYNNTSNTKDWMHMNGIDYNAELDQITFSCHNLNELYVIDHSTTTAQAASHSGGNSGKGGDLLYRWGNPAAYSATNGTNYFHTVHDAHFVPSTYPKGGYLVGYNNNGISNSQSSVDLVSPPYSGYKYTMPSPVGASYTPLTYTYRHACNGHNSNMGNSEQFPNGNMLVCIAQSGTVYEIDSNGTQLWSYTATGTIPQAHRYTECFINGPSVTAAATAPTICAGTSTALSATATNGTTYSYAWSSSPAGFSSASQNPTVSPTATTIYTVTVTSGSCTATASSTVTVNPAPTASAGNDVTISQGNATTLTATGGSSYSWSNGASTDAITVSPTSTTTYTVTVTGANSCTASDDVVVNVTGGTLSVSATTANGTICAGNSTQLNAAASGGSGNNTYSWSSSPAGFTSSSANATVTPATTTIYTVTVNDGNGTATASVTVTVNPAPTADAGNNVSINSGQSTTLTASGGSSFVWNTGATTSSITVTPGGTATYTVTVTDANGCTASDQVTVTILGGTLSATASASPLAVCLGSSTQLDVVVSGGNGTNTFAWSSNPAGFTSALQNPVVSPTASTSYTVTVTSNSSTATSFVSVTVNPLPATPTISTNGSALISSSSTGNQWFLNGNTIDGASDATYTPTENGDYTVQVTDANGCVSASSNVISFTTGIETLPGNSLALYPNPAKDQLYLKGDIISAGNYETVIYNAFGQMVLTAPNTQVIDITGLASGMYMVTVKSAEGSVIKRKISVLHNN
ncbi:MAG: aryl-sulfate sulfotransferase [Chitinophagales bacterium]